VEHGGRYKSSQGGQAVSTAPSYFEHNAGQPQLDVVEFEHPEEITVRIVTLTPERAEQIRRQIEEASL
jgi:hypothetical protein